MAVQPQKVKDLYSKGDKDQIIDKNVNFFTMCLVMKMNLGEGIKKLIDSGVRYPEIILSLHEALEHYPKNELTKTDLEALKILEKMVIDHFPTGFSSRHSVVARVWLMMMVRGTSASSRRSKSRPRMIWVPAAAK